MSDVVNTLADTDLALRVPLEGVQQIEASAGTGKTYTIAGLYARLLVERGLDVRQILVMTFTKAATEELRQRLRSRLARCARIAREPWLADGGDVPADADHETRWAVALLRRALADGETPAERLARRLEQAVTRMDEAAIFTIHGFCQRVLGEHAALIDGVDTAAAMEPSDDDLLETFAADAWLRLGGDGGGVTRDALQAFGASPAELAHTLRLLVDFDGAIEPQATRNAPDALEVDMQAAREALVQAWTRDGEAATAVFREAFEAGHLHGRSYKDGCLEQLETLCTQLVLGGLPAPAQLQKFAGSKLAGSTLKKAPAFPGHPAFDAIDAWLEAVQEQDEKVRARVPAVLQRLVAEARTWLAVRKRDLARMSYADQIAWVHHGLQHGASGRRLVHALRTQYPVALVDEFQDTDARQFAIFHRLYAEHGTLFCIGDPKQAIYGFRGGDVHAYLRARRLADGHASLAQNFRSSPGFLRACDALFSVREDVFVESGIDFESVEPGGPVDNGELRLQGDPVTPMTLWRLPTEPPSGGKPALEALLASACAETVVQWLAPGAAQLRDAALRPGSIAVLVDTNRQAMRVQDALAGRGVPAVCLRRESVFATEEAIELCRLLDALLAPRHPGLARAALATRLLGRRLSDLVAMRDEDADWRRELDDLRLRWSERGIQALIERLGERHAPRLLAADDGERRLSNLMQLGDVLQAEARRLSGLRAQRDWLARRIERADADNEEEQLRLESDAERVQILTIHASKGLEYDLVFMPFAALMQATPPAKGRFARFHRGDDLVMRFIATDSQARDADDAQALGDAQREALAEGVRKLYVGVTRARHACWLSVRPGPDAGKGYVLDHVLPEGPAPMLERAGGSATGQVLPERSTTVSPPAPVAAARVARRFDRPLDRDWRRHSFTRLAEGGHESVVEDTNREADTGGASVPGLAPGLHGSRFGSTVHDILEHIDFAAWAGPEPPPGPERGIVERALAAQGFAGAAAPRAVEALVARTLRTPIVDDLRLADLPASARRAEMGFDFGIAGVDPAEWLARMHAHGYQVGRRSFAHVGTRLAGLMNGLIDLVFVHRGRWWIVDYKTNHLGDRLADYAPEAMAAAVHASDYDLQYLIYTVALHRWLTQVRGAAYDYERDFGGVRYLFMRAMGLGSPDHGIHAARPPAALVHDMDRLLHAPGDRP